ncbi:MAG: hypothetical protein QOG35_623 [Solirubrobacteraceae bacterium]|nr:hypothetical protein [Solirubrobacteraceae bacterium]
MDYDRFLTAVEQAAGVDRERAELATRATLQTLAERIAAGEARDLAAELPAELAPWIGTTTPAERFGVDEFVRRIAEREEVDVADAERHARAVLGALGQAVSPRELDDVAAELPKDFAALLPRGRYVEVVPADEFVRRVAERAGLDPDRARLATDAVLETLAERIAGGEVDDLVVHLPLALHPPLQRGRERASGQATRMSVEDFIGRVAEREGVSFDQARDHARAVLVTLREAVGDEEFLDVTVQLPREYETVTAPP